MLEFKEQITILPLTIDGVFKMYFEDPRNLPELRHFLTTHIDLETDDLENIEVLNPGLAKDNPNDKGFTVDLLLKTKLGNDIHLEMQTNPHLNFKKRIQLYNARKAGGQVKMGQDYTHVKRTISLIIADFPVFHDADDYQEAILMRRKNGKVFTNVQEIHIIDLTKINSVISNDKQKYLWGKLFTAETKEELKMLANESKEMANATEKLIQISADERAQAYAMSRENSEFARKLHEQGLKEQNERAVKQGIEQGVEYGEQQKAIEIARRFLAMGLSIEIVAKGSGLPHEELEQLKIEIEDQGN